MIAARLALLLIAGPMAAGPSGPSALQTVEGTPSAVVARLAREALAGTPKAEARVEPATSADTTVRDLLAEPGSIFVFVGGATLALALATGGVVAWRSHRRRRAAPPRTRPGLYWAARSLTAAGSSRAEIARRTGLPQDALSALAWIERASSSGGKAW